MISEKKKVSSALANDMNFAETLKSLYFEIYAFVTTFPVYFLAESASVAWSKGLFVCKSQCFILNIQAICDQNSWLTLTYYAACPIS